jgi:hypothetical protein
MSDVGRLRRSGGTVFPSVRKSADPFVPESGEMDFSQELSEFDALSSTSVREPEATEQTVIREENRRKQFKYRKRHRKEEEEETPKEEEILVDLSA